MRCRIDTPWEMVRHVAIGRDDERGYRKMTGERTMKQAHAKHSHAWKIRNRMFTRSTVAGI